MNSEKSSQHRRQLKSLRHPRAPHAQCRPTNPIRAVPIAPSKLIVIPNQANNLEYRAKARSRISQKDRQDRHPAQTKELREPAPLLSRQFSRSSRDSALRKLIVIIVIPHKPNNLQNWTSTPGNPAIVPHGTSYEQSRPTETAHPNITFEPNFPARPLPEQGKTQFRPPRINADLRG